MATKEKNLVVVSLYYFAALQRLHAAAESSVGVANAENQRALEDSVDAASAARDVFEANDRGVVTEALRQWRADQQRALTRRMRRTVTKRDEQGRPTEIIEEPCDPEPEPSI